MLPCRRTIFLALRGWLACCCHTSSLNVWSFLWRRAALQVLSATLPSTPRVQLRCSRLWAHHWCQNHLQTFLGFFLRMKVLSQIKQNVTLWNSAYLLLEKKKCKDLFKQENFLRKKNVKSLVHKMPKHTASTFHFCVCFLKLFGGQWSQLNQINREK